MPFQGFRKSTLDFLVENHIQNSKSWFEEHRETYNNIVLKPLRELVLALTPTMLTIDPDFTVTPSVNKTIARIYRDTRFSRDKSLFRDKMWITFMRNKKFWEGLPGYYFLFGPDGWCCGFGYYEASRQSMDCLRTMILQNEKSFQTALKAYEKQNTFKIQGEYYKRSKFPDKPDRLRKWLDLKNVSFEYQSVDFDLLYSPALADFLADGFKKLKPLYDFICAVEERKNMTELKR